MGEAIRQQRSVSSDARLAPLQPYVHRGNPGEDARGGPAHAEGDDEDADARSARDLRSSQLREAYFLTRDELSVAFGEQALTTCGYANPDRDPVILSQQAKGFADRIRKFEPKREPRIKNYVFDGNEIATRLEGACHEFDAAMSEVTAEMKQTDEARAERNRAVSEFDDALRFGANLTSSLLELLGYAELARKVKPSSRRSGLTVGVEEETPPEELIDDAA